MSQQGGVRLFSLASQIRLPNEDWQAAIQRARQQLMGMPKKRAALSGCVKKPQSQCQKPCGWRKAASYVTKKGKSVQRRASCAKAGDAAGLRLYQEARRLGRIQVGGAGFQLNQVSNASCDEDSIQFELKAGKAKYQLCAELREASQLSNGDEGFSVEVRLLGQQPARVAGLPWDQISVQALQAEFNIQNGDKVEYNIYAADNHGFMKLVDTNIITV